MIELAATATLTGLGLWILFGSASFLAYPLIQRHLGRLHPSQSSALLLCWLALPFLGSLLITTLLYWSELAMWLVAEHCHASSCRQHAPSTPLALLPAASLFGWVLFRLFRCYQQQYLPARRLSQQLTHLATLQADYYELPSTSPAAFTLGWLHPRIYITRGLIAQCNTNDIRCIVDHEQGHQQRQDNCRLLLAWLLTAPLPQRWAQNMLDDHRLYCEQACDLIACQNLPAEGVADTLLRVARLQQAHSPIGSSAFTNSHIELRIRALLGEQPERLSGSTLLVVNSSLLVLIVLLVNPIHYLLERLQ